MRLIVLFLVFLPLSLSAQEAKTYSPDYLSLFMSLGIVIIAIFVLASLVKKFNLAQPGSKDIKVVTNLALGPREKLLVIEIEGKQHLIGSTPNQINYLLSLEKNITVDTTPINIPTQLKKILKHGKDE